LAYGSEWSWQDDYCLGCNHKIIGSGFRTEVLDGDEIRGLLSRDLGFSMEDRNENVRRLAFIADLLTRHGVIVFVAAISPYRAASERALGTHLQFS
jgi:adenylylsulfate kinase